MRILQLVSGDKINGAIKHCFDLTVRLRDRGHELCVACLPDSWIAQQLSSEGISTVATDLKRSYAEFRRLARFINDNRYEVMHTHKSRAHLFGVLLRWHAKIPVVATAHNRLFQLHWMLNDHVIAVSDATREFQVKRNFVDTRRIQTIHNFVDLSEPRVVPPGQRSAFFKEQKIPPQSQIVTFVGTIDRRKGLAYLVESLPDIIRQHPNACFLVVGQTIERDYKAKFCRRARHLGVLDRMRFLGRRSDVPDLLAMSDIFVLPSREESFPLTILEAMAGSLPVVATNVGGVKECVIDGETGFVVPAQDPAELARRLIDLLADENLRKRFGMAGRETVKKNFGPESQIGRIENVFEHVIENYRPSMILRRGVA